MNASKLTQMEQLGWFFLEERLLRLSAERRVLDIQIEHLKKEQDTFLLEMRKKYSLSEGDRIDFSSGEIKGSVVSV